MEFKALSKAKLTAKMNGLEREWLEEADLVGLEAGIWRSLTTTTIPWISTRRI